MYDFINLLAYISGTPDLKHNWSYTPGNTHAETYEIYTLILGMHKNGTPSPDDLVRTFIIRRVCPLQRRMHKICQMSGYLGLNQMTTFDLEKPEVVKKVKAITQTHMEVDWEWYQEPYSRARPAPRIRFRHILPQSHLLRHTLVFGFVFII
jgi:hypothetical protein